MSRDNDPKGKNLLKCKCHVTMTKKDAYISIKMQFQIHSLTSILKNKSLLLATSILSRSAMAYNTTVSLDKLTCTDYVDFGKCQDKSGQVFLSKNDSNYLDVKLKVFRKDDNKELDWSTILRWEKRISTNLCHWGISWSMRQKTLLERKNWRQCWYLQCPKTWMNNSHWVKR